MSQQNEHPASRHPLWRFLALYRLMPGRFLLTATLFINLGIAWQQ
jgi:ATP-binding cassette subfamily B multidrug efflux pump